MIFKCRKVVGFRGFAPDPTGGAYSAPPDPLAGVAELNQWSGLVLYSGSVTLKKQFFVLFHHVTLVTTFYLTIFLVLIINCG